MTAHVLALAGGIVRLGSMRVKGTTDRGDWSTMPRRLRLAFASLLPITMVIGVGLGSTGQSFGWVLLVSPILGVVWALVFDRRRPWWPPEPTLAVDPIGGSWTRNLMIALALVVVGLLLVVRDTRAL